jgi:MerR family transcriptional regulator/heat shock protein HspR
VHDDQDTSKADDSAYPAYSMGAAADILGVEPAFLRALGRCGLLTPHVSRGRHRRYSRDELDLAARARQVVDDGMTLAAACRIVALEQQLQQAHAAIAMLQSRLDRCAAATTESRAGEPDGRDP